MSNEVIYGGISGCELEKESFNLGKGVIISKSYAYIFAPFLAAFAPKGPSGYSPAPWSVVEGGLSFEIKVQIYIPESFEIPNWLGRDEVIWWIGALLRLSKPFITIPVISDTPFSNIPKSEQEAHLKPMEITSRMIKPSEDYGKLITGVDLEWIREHWIDAGHLMCKNNKLNTAFRAFDSAMIQKEESLSLISLWAGLEQLFSPSRSELRFRISSLIASFLEKPSVERLALYKSILKMYDERSVAAHTTGGVETGKLLETFVLMRNILVKIIENNHVPDSDDLESFLFCAANDEGCEETII